MIYATCNPFIRDRHNYVEHSRCLAFPNKSQISQASAIRFRGNRNLRCRRRLLAISWQAIPCCFMRANFHVSFFFFKLATPDFGTTQVYLQIGFFFVLSHYSSLTVKFCFIARIEHFNQTKRYVNIKVNTIGFWADLKKHNNFPSPIVCLLKYFLLFPS